MIYTPGLLVGTPPVLPPASGDTANGTEGPSGGDGGALPKGLPPSLNWTAGLGESFCFGLEKPVCDPLPAEINNLWFHHLALQPVCRGLANGLCLVLGTLVLLGLVVVAIEAFLR